jgi:hypothetical protein
MESGVFVETKPDHLARSTRDVHRQADPHRPRQGQTPIPKAPGIDSFCGWRFGHLGRSGSKTVPGVRTRDATNPGRKSPPSGGPGALATRRRRTRVVDRRPLPLSSWPDHQDRSGRMGQSRRPLV